MHSTVKNLPQSKQINKRNPYFMVIYINIYNIPPLNHNTFVIINKNKIKNNQKIFEKVFDFYKMMLYNTFVS